MFFRSIPQSALHLLGEKEVLCGIFWFTGVRSIPSYAYPAACSERRSLKLSRRRGVFMPLQTLSFLALLVR